MIKSILLLLFLPLLLISVYGEIQQEIFITTDKTEYYKDESIFVNGTITEIDWSENTRISYIVKDVKNIRQLGIRENIMTLNNDGTFSFTIDYLERESWTSYSGNVNFFIIIQNTTTNIPLYISDQLNMSNEFLYERSMNHEERILSNYSTLSTHDIMIYSHDTMVNEHNQNFISNNDKIDALLITVSELQIQTFDQSIIISALQKELKGIKELVQGEAPLPNNTPIPVIDNFTAAPTGNGEVTISWIITDGEPITLYNLIYRADVGSWTTENISVNATSYVVSGLANIEYDFKFSAENEFGESKVERFLITP